MEKQIGTIKGHRVVIKRDLKDNKPISYEVAEYLSVKDFETLQQEVALKQAELQKEKEALKIKFEEEEKERAYQEELLKVEEAYKKKYSNEHFLIAYNSVLHRIILGIFEDDGTFPSLLEKVKCKELTIEEAVNSNEELTFIFDNFFTD